MAGSRTGNSDNAVVQEDLSGSLQSIESKLKLLAKQEIGSQL